MARAEFTQTPSDKGGFVTAVPSVLINSFAELQNSGCERKQNLNTSPITVIPVFIFCKIWLSCTIEFFYLLVVNTDSSHYCDGSSLPFYVNVKNNSFSEVKEIKHFVLSMQVKKRISPLFILFLALFLAIF